MCKRPADNEYHEGKGMKDISYDIKFCQPRQVWVVPSYADQDGYCQRSDHSYGYEGER